MLVELVHVTSPGDQFQTTQIDSYSYSSFIRPHEVWKNTSSVD